VILDIIHPTDTSRVVHDVIHRSLMLAAILCSKNTIQSETWDEIDRALKEREGGLVTFIYIGPITMFAQRVGNHL
jgi:hypothetical protein